jgi:very-short-patch-repair endonuclease/predicted transcriptional regulator of viral defense system
VANKTRQIEGDTAATPAPESIDHKTRDPIDRTIARIAERQYGLISRRQLYGLGLSARTIERGLSRGRLHCVHRGVYAVGHRRLTPRGHWLAAVLAAGPGAVLSHRSAGAHLGLRPTASARVDVTVCRRAARARPGVAVHVTRELLERDWTTRDGIPVTSVARTLLDLAGLISSKQLSRALEAAERAELFDLLALEDVCSRANGRRGLGALRQAIADQTGPPPATRSELERDLLELCDAHRLQRPQVNVLVLGFEADGHWPGARLVLECDSFEFHRTRAAFERDRERDVALQLAGYTVLRFTHRRMIRNPEEVAAAIRSLLSRSPPDWPASQIAPRPLGLGA